MPRVSGLYPGMPSSGLSQISRNDPPLQVCQLLRQQGCVASIPPVADYAHDRALAEHPSRPLRVEGAQRLARAGAARPVRT